jgi:FlaA1/EpsC-like NDP-sugar epimerase
MKQDGWGEQKLGASEINGAQRRAQRAQRVAQVLNRIWQPAYTVASTNRRLATTFVYSLMAVIAYSAAFLLRFDFSVPHEMRAALATTLPLVVVLRLLASYVFRISTGRWRYVGTRDVARLVASTTSASAVLFLLTWGLELYQLVPRSVIVIDLFLYTWATAGVWMLYRTGFEQFRLINAEHAPSTRILIVGAGEAGSMLAREMIRSSYRRQAFGFVDDDPAKWNTTLHGLPVFGSVTKLEQLVRRHGVDEIVIAVPSATPGQLRRIVEACEATDLRFQVLPGLSDVLEGRVNWSQVRPLRIEDLLGREPIALELPELVGDLHGRSVLITGAAGSIGSELARQVALHHPRTLVLFDQSETGLFDLSHELLDQHADIERHFVVGDVADETAVADVFRRFAPSRVFHAAAYKHVTMMQTNLRQAIRNNVTGTMLVAAAAGRSGTDKFVFVSTDKAVSPTSVMGASKRLAEMLLMQLQSVYPGTAFAAVRFGNVLGSNGSVIPIFRRQIEQGRPLTVTHPDASRYFMMIPEAVQLILQASLLPEVRGQIAMLDMGEPVRIVDLARNLLRIAGLPHKNGKSIVFTGLRPGEKLHEELEAPGERTRPTRIDKVRFVEPDAFGRANVVQLVAEWETALREGRDEDVALALAELFPGLRPSLSAERPAVRQVV